MYIWIFKAFPHQSYFWFALFSLADWNHLESVSFTILSLRRSLSFPYLSSDDRRIDLRGWRRFEYLSQYTSPSFGVSFSMHLPFDDWDLIISVSYQHTLGVSYPLLMSSFPFYWPDQKNDWLICWDSFPPLYLLAVVSIGRMFSNHWLIYR